MSYCNNELTGADVLVCIAFLIAVACWGYGIYFFGAEAYSVGWQVGPVAMLALWTICALPIIFGGLCLVGLLLFCLGCFCYYGTRLLSDNVKP